MGKHNHFNRKGKSDSSGALTTKKKFTAPTVGPQDVYFTWGAVRDAARNVEVVDKLKEYVAVHFCDQATPAARAMEELKPPIFVKTDCPVRVYWADEGQTRTTNNK